MRRAVRCLRAMAAMVFVSGHAAAADAPPAPPPVKDFFSADQMSQPVLSPSGKYLAVRLATSNGRRQLAVIDLVAPALTKAIAGYVNADIAAVHWVNDERLVYTITDLQAEYGDGFAPGLYAVDRNGNNPRPLVRRFRDVSETGTRIVSRELSPYHHLLDTVRDGSADVIVERYDYDSRNDFSGSVLFRLDTLTGSVRSIETGMKQRVRDWLVDDSGQARVAEVRIDDRSTVFWRPAADAPWVAVSQGQTYTGGAGTFSPMTLGPDGQLYARATRGDAEGTAALFRFDAKTQHLEAQPVVGVQGFDFRGRLIFDHRQRKLLGVRYTADARDTAWFDADMKAVQAAIDKRLPSTINLLDVAECNCSPWVVVTAYSDRQPPIYLIYNREKSELAMLGNSRSAIDPTRMAQREFVRIPMRDGLSTPMHVTRPSGKGPWPTVVLVHGGPQVRGGSWGWYAESQFLASRGYLVVEPEFRGSTGYGQKLFRAGWKQWGLAMQDDVADATRWAIQQKFADPQRICIAGASYGGYATLMGLIRDPDLYRCGVAWAAVTDIQLMFDLHWSDLSEEWKQFGLPVLVGDPEKNADQFVATSPLKQAHRLKLPLLLAHGGSDRRVPIAHGSRFRDAVAKTNSSVDWVVYNDEGHGWFKPENRYDWWTRVEKFLGQQIGPK